MKKWLIILGIAVFLAFALVAPRILALNSGEKAELLGCLPDGQWLEFEGGCGNPTNHGAGGLNLDHRRDTLGIPDEIQLTTEETVRAALDGLTIRTGKAQKSFSAKHVHMAPAGEKNTDFFQYDFKSEARDVYRLRIFEDGCIEIRINEAPYPDDYHDKGGAYEALDARFANIHEYREFMDIADSAE